MVNLTGKGELMDVDKVKRELEAHGLYGFLMRRFVAAGIWPLEVDPHADAPGARAGGPQAGGQGAEDVPLEHGPDHQRGR